MQRFHSNMLWMALITGLLLLTPNAIMAQQTEKIGFVNMEEALATSDVGKAANEDFKKFYEKSKKTIQDKERELQKRKDELEKQRPILKEQVLKDKELDYQKRFRAYQELVKDSNDDLNTRRQDLINKYIPELMKIVNSIGEKDKYTMIIDLSTVPISYFKKENNITKRLIDEFNKSTQKK
ncbi:MAG: OmpH family outer membrane protein [Syntrophales bacterium]|nr:OmpH family outer membrane protein [Syntrophales bacterium]